MRYSITNSDQSKTIRPLPPFINSTVLRQKVFFLIFNILISYQAKSQEIRTFTNSINTCQKTNKSGLHKNIISVNAGSAAFLWHWNVKFEKMIISTQDNFFNTIWLSASYGRNYYTMSEGVYHSASIILESLSGKGNHHFEIGLGLSYEYAQTRYTEMLEGHKWEPENYEKPNKSEFDYFFPAGFAGYRYQKQNGDFILRTG